VACSQVGDGLPTNADIEDLFEVEDYLRLYNWAFGTTLAPAALPATSEPVLRRLEAVVGKFDHALPAHALTEHRDEYFGTIKPKTVDRFGKLFKLLNATVL
jgi:hypothetical protein